MSTIFKRALPLMVVLMAFGSVSYAQKAQTEPGAVGLGGETLFVFKAETDLNKSMTARTNDVYDRIRYVVNNPRLKASDIRVKKLGDYGYKIVANNQLIVPVGAAEAKAHNMTTESLAEEWAKNLRKVLPRLKARPDLFVAGIKRVGSPTGMKRVSNPKAKTGRK